jgi:excisionase family DNA binding protein
MTGSPAKAPSRAASSMHTVTSVAERLGVSEKTVRRLIARGELPVHRIGHSLRVSEDDLQAFLKQHRG